MVKHDEYCEAKDEGLYPYDCQCASRAWARDPLPDALAEADEDAFEGAAI